MRAAWERFTCWLLGERCPRCFDHVFVADRLEHDEKWCD